MSYYYGRDQFLVDPADLIAFAWSAPMRDLAAKVGISDVGLKKLLKGFEIATPPQGHWNKINAGKKVLAPPKSPIRRAGETGRLRIDTRFAPYVPEAAPLPASGPFATPHVPEDLEELRSQELKAIGKATVPRSLDLAHPGLRQIIEKENRRRQKDLERSWSWKSTKFEGPVDQRKLRLLNGIFLALAKRGHGGDAYEHGDGHEIHARAFIGDMGLGLELEIAGKHKTALRSGYYRPDPDLPASTPLVLRVKPGFDREIGDTWQDEADAKLESRIGEIAAALIVAGEAKFRRQLRESEERAERERIEREAREEQARIDREQRRLELIRQLNEQRIADLQKSGELLRLSRDIRALVSEVRTAMAARDDLDADTVAAWEQWALSEADKVDPILSGQVLTHLRPPEMPPPETS